MTAHSDFQLFGLTHLASIGIILGLAFAFVAVARSQRFQGWGQWIRFLLVFILLGNELIGQIVAIRKGLWSYEWGLPLQICDLAIFTAAYSLFWHRQLIWELTYFWGLAGTLQAILTPDLQVTFPDPTYIKFFTTHGSILISVIFLAAGCGRPIYSVSIKRVFWATNIYALLIGFFNWILQTNYGYLCEKPEQTSLLTYLGPWPFYLLTLEGVLFVSLWVYYAPYYVINKWKSKRRDL